MGDTRKSHCSDPVVSGNTCDIVAPPSEYTHKQIILASVLETDILPSYHYRFRYVIGQLYGKGD